MRKRIAAVAVLALGSGLLNAVPASAATYRVFSVPDSSYISTYYTNVVADREVVDNLDNAFIVYTKSVNSAGAENTPAKGTLVLTSPDGGADWDASIPLGMTDGNDNDTFGEAADSTISPLGGGAYSIQVAADYVLIPVGLNEDAAAGTYTATVKFGDAVSTVTYKVVNVPGSSAYIATRGDYPSLAGYGARTFIEFNAHVNTAAGSPKTSVTVTGPGVQFMEDTALLTDNCDAALKSPTATSFIFNSGAGCWSAENGQGYDDQYSSGVAYFPHEKYDPTDPGSGTMSISTPYAGDVTIAMFEASGNSFLTSAYMSLTFKVSGTIVAPVAPEVATATSVTKVQTDLAAVTASVAALQTALASLVASTSATLATLAAKISKIMKKLKIK